MKEAPADELTLIARLVAGDTAALASLYDLQARAVHQFLWAFLDDREATADAVQDTFLIAWRRRRSIRLASPSLLPWLLAIARNVAMNELRRRRRHPESALDSSILLVEGPERLAEARIELEQVLRQIRGLESLDREILQLCVFDGLTYAQAARKLHITTTAVGKRIERTRKRLRPLPPAPPRSNETNE